MKVIDGVLGKEGFKSQVSIDDIHFDFMPGNETTGTIFKLDHALRSGEEPSKEEAVIPPELCMLIS